MPKPILQLLSIIIGLIIWYLPVPDGLSAEAWHLFAIFAATIFSVLVGAFPILLASILALVAAILTNTLSADVAYGGFSEGFILLIVVAFVVGRGVVNSGLGHRIGYLLVRSFGGSSLGLSYAMIATDDDQYGGPGLVLRALANSDGRQSGGGGHVG